MELPTVGARTYVDPQNYDRPEDAICEFASEIDASRLYLEMLIGGGKNIACAFFTRIYVSLSSAFLFNTCFSVCFSQNC